MKKGKYIGNHVMIACLSHRKIKKQNIDELISMVLAESKTSSISKKGKGNRVLAAAPAPAHSWVL